MTHIPDQIKSDIRTAKRLEYWTIGWQASIIVVMFLVMGASQAMKSAWAEDLLGLAPATVFLIALHFEKKAPTRQFPYGFSRANSIAFLVSATTLMLMGAYLIYDSSTKLIQQEHPTIGPVHLFGKDIWLGWAMVAALIYSVVPPIILGRLKQPVAKRMHDKVLHTDALMQKADWMTGLAAAAGVIGVGFGLWWADSLAALVIAVDIVRDGWNAFRIALAELADGAPRALDTNEIADDASALKQRLEEQFPEGHVRMRESGRLIMAEIADAKPGNDVSLERLWPGDRKTRWRLGAVSFLPERARNNSQ
ncbi:MAG: cation diffusion facilitator family transporter [Alphaproteobacteria bacterium]|nr:cation diffusion facilitator family transporter [Alphaproteobacteria bacterium]